MANASIYFCVAGDVVAAPVTQSVAANANAAIDVLGVSTINGVLGGTLDNPPRITQPPAHGTVVWNASTQRFDYTPHANYCGPDTFQYELVSLQQVEIVCGVISNAQTAKLNSLLQGFVWGVTPAIYVRNPSTATVEAFNYNAGANYYASLGPYLPEMFCVKTQIGGSNPPTVTVALTVSNSDC